MNSLDGRRVLVTGATGFVGGHLCERLVEEGAQVTGSGRQVDRMPEGVDRAEADLRDAEVMARLVRDQEIVFHVAAWTKGSESAHAINVDATAQLLRLCREAGVARIVHVGSIASYGPPGDGDLFEDTPLDTSDANDEYGRTKALGERAALATEGVAIVRPGQIYGPGSWTWTAGFAKLVKKGVPTVIGKGDGFAAPVYIDSVVDMLVRAAVSEDAAGRAFNCVDTAVPWREVMEHFARMTGRPLRRIPMPIARVLAAINEVVPLGLPINRSRLRYVAAKPVYRTDAAREVLGWEPSVSLDEGMRRSEAWLREIGRL